MPVVPLTGYCGRPWTPNASALENHALRHRHELVLRGRGVRSLLVAITGVSSERVIGRCDRRTDSFNR